MIKNIIYLSQNNSEKYESTIQDHYIYAFNPYLGNMNYCIMKYKADACLNERTISRSIKRMYHSCSMCPFDHASSYAARDHTCGPIIQIIEVVKTIFWIQSLQLGGAYLYIYKRCRYLYSQGKHISLYMYFKFQFEIISII